MTGEEDAAVGGRIRRPGTLAQCDPNPGGGLSPSCFMTGACPRVWPLWLGPSTQTKPPPQTNASGLFCHQRLLECHPPGRPRDPGDGRLPWASEGPSSYVIISLKNIT